MTKMWLKPGTGSDGSAVGGVEAAGFVSALQALRHINATSRGNKSRFPGILNFGKCLIHSGIILRFRRVVRPHVAASSYNIKQTLCQVRWVFGGYLKQKT